MHELRVAGGKKVERHLCEQCARDDGIAVPGGVSVPELIEKMLTPGATGSTKPATPATPPEPACPTCGTTYSQFRQSGQLGCPRCYEAFEGELGPLLERWHEGGSHHVGKVPARALRTGAPTPAMAPAVLGGAEQHAKKIQALRKQLEEAVRSEQYERAATLRDEIQRLSTLGGTIAPGA